MCAIKEHYFSLQYFIVLNGFRKESATRFYLGQPQRLKITEIVLVTTISIQDLIPVDLRLRHWLPCLFILHNPWLCSGQLRTVDNSVVVYAQ